MFRAKLPLKLGRRVHGRIDVPSEARLRLRYGVHDILKRRVPDHEQVNVARHAEFAASGRTEHECHQNLFTQRREPLAKRVGKAGGLGEQALQLREDRRLAISLEVHLPTLNRALQESGGRQLLELALHRADGRTRVPDDLTKIVRFVRVAEQPPEYTSAGAAEEQVRGVDVLNLGRCSHLGNKRTHSWNKCQPASLR
jgi:hypothetical protein